MDVGSLRILQLALDTGGGNHPHFMDEKIELQGPSGSGHTALSMRQKEFRPRSF